MKESAVLGSAGSSGLPSEDLVAYASEGHSGAVLGGGWDCVIAALVVIRCYHRAPSLWKESQIIQFDSDLRSVGDGARRGIDLCVVMVAWEAVSLII